MVFATGWQFAYLAWVNINVWGASMTGFEIFTPAVGLVFGVVNMDQFSILGLAMRACATAQNFARNTPLLVTSHSDWNSIDIGFTVAMAPNGGRNSTIGRMGESLAMSQSNEGFQPRCFVCRPPMMQRRDEGTC